MAIAEDAGLKHSGIPLGGLGTGTVEIRGDGLFHEWQIMNNAPCGRGPKAVIPTDALHVGLQVHGEGISRSAILSDVPESSSTLNDAYSMPWLQHAKVEATARFPFTNLAFSYDDVPVKATLEAFSPFIPLDAKNSGLPVAFVTYGLKNTSRQPVTVTLFACQRNLTGYATTGKEALSTIDISVSGKRPHLAFSREAVSEKQSDFGTMVLGMLPEGAGKTSYVAHHRPRDIWDPLRATGLLENIDWGSMEADLGNMGASARVRFRAGRACGSLARTTALAPGQSTKITVVLCWHFPNFMEEDNPYRGLTGSNIGHQYSNWFKNATEVFNYAARNFKTLRSETRLFFDAYYRSSMPDWLLDAVSAQLTTLTKASWWDRAGRFAIWEGLGCCGLQTTDITHYGSFPIAQFFPEIQKSQMRLTRDNIEETGKIPHMMPGTFACCDLDRRERIDLIPQFILLIWRDLLWTGDRAYLEEMWETIKEALGYFETKDTDGDGLPNNSGPDQTYDQFPLKGTSAFVGILYLSALHAAGEMAALMGDDEFGDELRRKSNHALPLLREQLWNGEYFRLSYDPVDGEMDEGVMADQLNGDWFMRQTIGDGLMDDRSVKSALKSILKHCLQPTGYLANCAWPNGGAVEISRNTADQANWPWSGVEYAVAAHLILMGMTREGINLTRCVWNRYERMGMRFDHIECGHHYYRALSSWAVYLALSGTIVDLMKGVLKVRFQKTPVRAVVVAPTGWGRIETDKSRKTLKIQMERGRLRLRHVELVGVRVSRPVVRVNGKSCPGSLSKGAIGFKRAIVLKAGDSLTVKAN